MTVNAPPRPRGRLAAAGRLVRWHRQRSGWAQVELGRRLGISQAAVSQVECGAGGQTLTALALYIVGAPRAGELVAAEPRSAYARATRERAGRRARGEQRTLRVRPFELPFQIEAAALRQRAQGGL